MKKTIAILGLLCAALSFTAQPASAAFVQFNPKNAQFVSPLQKQNQLNKTANKASTTPAPKVLGRQQ